MMTAEEFWMAMDTDQFSDVYDALYPAMEAYAAHRTESDRAKIKALMTATKDLRDGYAKMLASAQCMNLHHELPQRHSGWECPVVNELSETLSKFDAALKLAGGE